MSCLAVSGQPSPSVPIKEDNRCSPVYHIWTPRSTSELTLNQHAAFCGGFSVFQFLSHLPSMSKLFNAFHCIFCRLSSPPFNCSAFLLQRAFRELFMFTTHARTRVLPNTSTALTHLGFGWPPQKSKYQWKRSHSWATTLTHLGIWILSICVA